MSDGPRQRVRSADGAFEVAAHRAVERFLEPARNQVGKQAGRNGDREVVPDVEAVDGEIPSAAHV